MFIIAAIAFLTIPATADTILLINPIAVSITDLTADNILLTILVAVLTRPLITLPTEPMISLIESNPSKALSKRELDSSPSFCFNGFPVPSLRDSKLVLIVSFSICVVIFFIPTAISTPYV